MTTTKPGEAGHTKGLFAALEAAIKVAGEAREEWDKAPEGMRAGKLLIAHEIIAKERIRDAAPDLLEAAKEVMECLEKHGASIVPHLLDSDDNPGQRLRDAIAKAESRS